MNEARDLQHPDITAIERDGYAWFPRKVEVQVSEKAAMEFCKENYTHFWEYLMIDCPYTLAKYVDEYSDAYLEWMGG